MLRTCWLKKLIALIAKDLNKSRVIICQLYLTYAFIMNLEMHEV